MKLLYMALYACPENSKPIRVTSAENLGSFSHSLLQRGTIRELLVFETRTTAERTAPNSRQTVALSDEVPFLCHVYMNSDRFVCCCVADREYPQRVAFSVLSKQLMQFMSQSGSSSPSSFISDCNSEYTFFQSNFTDFQNPNKADNLLAIQSELEEVKDVMNKNIEQVLNRGENLDTLMARSEDLSSMSVQFYKTAKKNNQCCTYY